MQVLQELIAAGWSNASLARPSATCSAAGLPCSPRWPRGRAPSRAARPVSAEELATLVASAFFGSESLLLLGFDREVLPIRSALRRVGVLIRQLEEGPTAPRRTEDTGMPAVP